MELRTIGIDLGETVFHLVGLNLNGEVVVRKRFSHTQLLRFTSNVHVHLIGMEACGGAHFLGRALRAQGMKRVSCRRSSKALRKDKQERLHRC
jgi:transposase